MLHIFAGDFVVTDRKIDIRLMVQMR